MKALPSGTSLTVEEYLALDRNSADTRYEYIDGRVVMLAGGTLNHTRISFNVARALHAALHGSGCHVFTSDARVRISQTCYVYPDVTVSCDERDDGDAEAIQYPRLVVEVLSPSTERYDRGKKLYLYRECPTIQEYMLVNTEYPAVEVLRREKKDLWIIQMFTPESEVELLRLGIRFPLAAAYENITFPEA